MVYGLQDVVNQRRMIDTSEVASEESGGRCAASLDAPLTLAEGTRCRRQPVSYFMSQVRPVALRH
jgi:ATP-dependent DNA helicase RecQ